MSGAVTAWAITTGCYSDYRVLSIFETEADAKAAADAYNAGGDEWHDDASVCRIPYFPAGVTPQRVTRHDFVTVLYDDGRVKSERGDGREHWSTTEWEYDQMFVAGPRPRLRYVRAPCYDGKAGRLEIRGTDFNACAQAFSDRVAMFKAGAWNPRVQREINEVLS